MDNTQVLIAGGGPVGMTLAAVLAQRGVRSILVERSATTTAHPKMDITNARSMELFRVLGLTGALRKVAVDVDHNFDVSWITDCLGEELHRFRYPSVTEHRAQIRARNDGSQPRESPMRVSQVEIEPVLRAHIEAQPLVDVRFGVEFNDLAQDADGVTSTITHRSSGAVTQVRSDYVVGCDGGGSTVRALVGIGLGGDARVGQRYMLHFRSPRKDLLMRWGVAWHYQSGAGTLIAQNDKDVWTFHARFPDDAQGGDPQVAASLLTKFVGQPIEHELLVANPWTPHLLVADAYRRHRVLLAGDSAHQYVPTGGYGMNTGIGDAFDLGWKLAAMLHGFGGQGLLESYEAERRPIGLRNREASKRHNQVRRQIVELYAGCASTPNRLAADIARLGNDENASWGIEWGYAYPDSPIVVPDPGARWHDDPLAYSPSTTPGVRLPSVFLPDGSALYDHLGPWFTLLLTDNATTASTFEAAARSRGIALKVVPLGAPELAPIYEAPAVLVRPDHHVSWRGNLPGTQSEADAILSRALGFS